MFILHVSDNFYIIAEIFLKNISRNLLLFICFPIHRLRESIVEENTLTQI